jgi:hypothetical protein
MQLSFGADLKAPTKTEVLYYAKRNGKVNPADLERDNQKIYTLIGEALNHPDLLPTINQTSNEIKSYPILYRRADRDNPTNFEADTFEFALTYPINETGDLRVSTTRKELEINKTSFASKVKAKVLELQAALDRPAAGRLKTQASRIPLDTSMP